MHEIPTTRAWLRLIHEVFLHSNLSSTIIGFAGGVMLPLLYWALQWLTFTFSTMVPTPGGVGGSEAAFLLLYAPFILSKLE